MEKETNRNPLNLDSRLLYICLRIIFDRYEINSSNCSIPSVISVFSVHYLFFQNFFNFLFRPSSSSSSSNFKKMAPPKIWLPPLNSYPDSSVSVVAEQPINSCYDPSILDPIFLVEVSVSVNFYSDRNDSDIMFKGLSHNQFFTIDSHELDSKESSGGAISELFRQSYIPFDLNEVYLTERQFRGEFVLPWPVKNLNSLVKKIGIFANRIRQETYNACHNILPLKLSICKRVTVPDWDIGAWIRGFNRKCRDDPDFEEEYMKAISRPRTTEEEQYELIKYD